MQILSTHPSYYTSRVVDENVDPDFYGIIEEECVFLKEVFIANAKKNKLLIQFLPALLQTSELLPTPPGFLWNRSGVVLIDCFPQKQAHESCVGMIKNGVAIAV